MVDTLLAEYGNDPTRYNWNNFRPLRLSREEDWSDWLAHLIHSSKTGCFSGFLFGDILKSELAFANPIFVKREDIQQGYRADIIIQWNNESFTHLEIKTGDMNMSKTHATGKILQEKYSANQENWSDFILLLTDQLYFWDMIAEAAATEKAIKAITWDDVCIAIRRSLISKESVTWKALAYIYLGAIEQHIIGFPGYRLHKRPVEQLDQKLNILIKGLPYEKRNQGFY